MSVSTVVVTEEAEDTAEEAVEEVAEEISDAVEDAQLHATDLDHESRLTRVEDGLALVATAVEALTEQISGLQFTDQIQQTEIQQVAEQQQEVAEEVADAIEETVEDVAEATEPESEEGSEVTPDEVPTVREHPFFRKWGKHA